MTIEGIVRAAYASRDRRGRLVLALAAYFAAPPTGGDESVPMPMTPEFWRTSVLKRAVPDRDLLGAILSDRRTALLCHALLGVDAETRAFIAANPSVVTDMDETEAGAFASFANIVRVRDGALQLPGGPAAASTWTALLGAPATDTRVALRALITVDYGRLALFTEALLETDGRHRDPILLPEGTDQAKIAAARSAYRSFVAVDLARNLTDLTFQRIPYGPADFLAVVPVADGMVPGPDGYWRALLDSDVVPSKGAAEWPAFDDQVHASMGSLLDRFALEPLMMRHEVIGMVAFVDRLAARFPDASLADRVLLGRAWRRYPALLATLERIGVDDLDVWRGLVMQARDLDAREGGSESVDMRSALLQAPIALVDRAVMVGSLDRHEAATLLARFAGISPAEAGYGHAVGRWMAETLLPALGRPEAGDGADETTLLEAMAGLHATSREAARQAASIQWESFTYRIDPAAAEILRLRDVRTRQGGNSLDTALALGRAVTTLSQAASPDHRRAAADVLSAAQSRLESISDDERVGAMPDVDVEKVVAQAVTDAGRPSSNVTNAAIAERLQRVEESVLADTLTSIVYALWLGDAEGQTFLGGNVARRHDFGRRSAAAAERDRARWAIPEEASGVGEPWHVRGALLALDVGLGRLALRRTTTDLPARQPRLNDSDRRALVATGVLTPLVSADQSAADRLVRWLRSGTESVGRLATSDAASALVRRLGLDDRRATAIRWTAAEDPADLPRLFLLTELTQLGRPDGESLPDGWGPASTAATGCLCRVFVDPAAPHRLSRLSATATVTAVMDDLELRVLAELAALHVPASLARGVIAAALPWYLDNARPAFAGDWWTFGELARSLSHDQVIDFVSALTAGGPLIPASTDR